MTTRELRHARCSMILLAVEVPNVQAKPNARCGILVMTGEKPAGARLLVVDDEALIRWSLGEHLTNAGYEVVEARDGASALDILGAPGRIDLVVLDLKLPDTDGLSLLKRIRQAWPTCKVVMMSAFATAEDLDDARHSGVAEIIPKPFDVQYLLKAVEHELANAA